MRGACEIVTEPLQPSLPNTGSLANILDNTRRISEVATGKEKFDVFISYAHEDGTEVANQLRVHLTARGVEVWIDQIRLDTIGQNLRAEIDRGIVGSRFAAVILTPAFFERPWTLAELGGCVARQIAGQQNILPVLHNITMEQLLDRSPTLADKISRSTGQYSISQIAAEIARVVQQTTELREQAGDDTAATFEEETGQEP